MVYLTRISLTLTKLIRYTFSFRDVLNDRSESSFMDKVKAVEYAYRSRIFLLSKYLQHFLIKLKDIKPYTGVYYYINHILNTWTLFLSFCWS